MKVLPIVLLALLSTSAEAGRWSRERVIAQPVTRATPAPPIPGLPGATLQYRQELAMVTAMLARNPNAFNGFNTTNTLAELRAQVDKNIRTRHAREMARATTATERVALAARHKAFWGGLAARRELRNKFTDAQNIVHSLMMIFQTRQKLININ